MRLAPALLVLLVAASAAAMPLGTSSTHVADAPTSGAAGLAAPIAEALLAGDYVLCTDLPADPREAHAPMGSAFLAQDDDAADKSAVSLVCPPAIRPGAASNSCTLNFVLTDGDDYYIGAAGHCAGLGKRLQVWGVPGEVGTAILRKQDLFGGDYAFFRIDKEDEAYIDPTMCRFGGPFGALAASRLALPGDIALHYGHGAAFGQIQETKGRVGAPVVPLPVISGIFAFVGSVAGGDSGSPVRAATGEAIGIAVATTSAGFVPGVVIATDFETARGHLQTFLGKPVWVVSGDVVPDWLQDATPAAA